MSDFRALLQEGMDGFSLVLVNTSDHERVYDWVKRCRAALAEPALESMTNEQIDAILDEYVARTPARTNLRKAVRACINLAVFPRPFPEGWQLVPKKMTLEMIKAANLADPLACDVDHAEDVYPPSWEAALAAAPAPEQEEKGEGEMKLPRTFLGWRRLFWITLRRCPECKGRLLRDWPQYDDCFTIYCMPCGGAMYPRGFWRAIWANNRPKSPTI